MGYASMAVRMGPWSCVVETTLTLGMFGFDLSSQVKTSYSRVMSRSQTYPPRNDIGHLAHGLDEDIADKGKDGYHEVVGERWLGQYFGPAVTEPVRLHVEAKRYLCAVDADYQARLSPASVKSLALQGGPLTPEGVREFEANPFFREAVRLRRWDDEAKVPGLDVPGLEV